MNERLLLESATTLGYRLAMAGAETFRVEETIIRVLPQEFFMDCAILIGLGLITMAVGILVWEGKRKK